MPCLRRASVLSLLLACLPAKPAWAQDDSAFFEQKIRPILVEHCYQCHSEKAKKKQGGLLLDSRAGLRVGGDSGPAVVPGKPGASLLLRAVRYDDPDLKMPPKGKLPAAVLADLETWIRRGAYDPREKAVAKTPTRAWDEALKERRRWWSLQPVRKPPLPVVKNSAWSAHPVDRFLLAKLEAKGLPPPQSADSRTLIRRLSLVLTGLPPTLAEMEAYCAAAERDSIRATEALVDRLLASPHFGERWARHWMDVVRFTETHGNEWNYEVHHAWRYRDYLIRAFNDDLPYDQFVREHVAGDLLTRWNHAGHFNEAPIGTAFWRFGEVNHDDCVEFRQIGYDLADNQIDTLTKAFQATTVACARCHDHKIDAVSMKDYYALLGIVRSSRLVAHTIDAPDVNAEAVARLCKLRSDILRELSTLWQREVGDPGRTLRAAQAALEGRHDAAELARGLDANRLAKFKTLLKATAVPLEDPLHPWLAMRAKEPASFAARWQQLRQKYATETAARSTFNAKNFTSFGDFRAGKLDGWRADGQGLRGGPTRGHVVLAGAGDAAIAGIYPAGLYTHSLSERLNGTLRSPLLPARKYVSFHVLGGKTSAVRLVSNNCQLNYVNYKALTKPDLQWLRFTIPADRASLRTYAELMTKLDNPKFPDQLGTLGGDTGNARVPWEQAAADPRSFFGITRAVVHDCEETPRPELSHMSPLFARALESEADLAEQYTRAARQAVEALLSDTVPDDVVPWLDWMLRRGLLTNSCHGSPRLAKLIADYRAVEARLAVPRVVPGLADAEVGYNHPVLSRGDAKKPGEIVPRRYLEVLDGSQHPYGPRGSGRRELAARLASAGNPLTARVMVNRLWHHLFGTGLVRTVDDFGHVGELPSHPELLDDLAARFVEDGWSVKKMLRFLVLSRAFQATSRASAAGRAVDPDNRLLHHYPARRLEAEAIRDAILSASGRLDRTLYGPSVHPYRDKAVPDRRLFPGPLDGAGRRSIYIKVNLMEPPKFLGAFNFPGGKVTQGRRDVTNVPAQALALLNDPFVVQQADEWAGRLIARPDTSSAARIDYLFRVALGRPPKLAERERFERAVLRLAELHGVAPAQVLRSRAVWKDVAHAMFNLSEFVYIR